MDKLLTDKFNNTQKLQEDDFADERRHYDMLELIIINLQQTHNSDNDDYDYDGKENESTVLALPLE